MHLAGSGKKGKENRLHFWFHGPITQSLCNCINTDTIWHAAVMLFNLIALRKAKIVNNFGLSECNRVT